MGKDEPTLSPLQPEQFDYNKLRDETAIPAMVEILKLIGDEAHTIVFTGQKQKHEIDDAYDKLSRKVIEVLVKHNVAKVDLPHCFQYFQSVIYVIEDSIKKQIQGHEREILSRTIGKRNPGSGKFDVDFTNMADLISSLFAVRKNTGDNVADYFHMPEPIIPPMEEGELPANEDTNG